MSSLVRPVTQPQFAPVGRSDQKFRNSSNSGLRKRVLCPLSSGAPVSGGPAGTTGCQDNCGSHPSSRAALAADMPRVWASHRLWELSHGFRDVRGDGELTPTPLRTQTEQRRRNS